MKGLSTLWIDAAGRQTITLIRTDTGGCPLQNDVINISSAMPLEEWEGDVDTHSPTPPAGTYLIGDWALLQFACADGSEATIWVPAPLPSIFLADGRTVDPTQVATLVGHATGQLVAYSGSLATAYLSGYRKSRTP